MAYAPSPRPNYTVPTPIPYATVTRHLWGDPGAGNVADWIYASTANIHQLMFGLARGEGFRHSNEFRTIFGADLIYYVYQGRMIIANPETGEVHRVQEGEAAFFRKDTWHHVFNDSDMPLRVVEYFAPPPSQGTSGAYARTKPLLETVRYGNDAYLERWPMARDERKAEATIHLLREQDALWQLLDGAPQPVLMGIWVSTEHLTAGKIHLHPGQSTVIEQHGGDECIFVLEGTVNILCPEAEGQSWFELNPRDGFFTPAGAPHAYHNIGATPATLLFGVAPTFKAAP